MTNDLSAPLGRKPQPARQRDGLKPSRLPLARIAFAVVGLMLAGVIARIALVDDPMGGRPVAEVDIASARNTIAETVAPSAVITALPEIPAGGPGVTIVGDDVPDGTDPVALAMPDASGLVEDLLEDSEHGAIPRKSAAGDTPFETYARPALTPATADGRKLIAIIATGLGLNRSGTAAAIETLPEAVTLAFAPYGEGLARAVADARADGHEILLELPLEPFDYPESDPGPDTLVTGRPPRENLDRLYTVMARFGGYVGVINHMGARFTASNPDFAPIMEELGSRGLGYLDDGSSNRSAAAQLAIANGVPFGRADRALDLNPARAPILEQLKALEATATERGHAIGVITALPVSVQTIAEWSRSLDEAGFVLVPASALMQTTQ